MDNRRNRPMRAVRATPLDVAPDATLPNPPCQAQPACMVLGMAYVPMQAFESLYTPEVGFDRGTVFSRLDLPYLGMPLDAEEVCCRG